MIYHSALHAGAIGLLWSGFAHVLVLTITGLGLGQLIRMPYWPVAVLGIVTLLIG